VRTSRTNNLALRQQLAAFSAGGRRPRITHGDRWFWIALRRWWSRWSDALVFIKPETVIRRHRDGFRLLSPLLVVALSSGPPLSASTARRP